MLNIVRWHTQTGSVGTLTPTKTSVFQTTDTLGSLSSIRLPAQSPQAACTLSHTPVRRSKRRQPRHHGGKDIRRQEKMYLVFNSSSSGTEDGVAKRRPSEWGGRQLQNKTTLFVCPGSTKKTSFGRNRLRAYSSIKYYWSRYIRSTA